MTRTCAPRSCSRWCSPTGLAVGSQTPKSPDGLLMKSAVFLWEATPPRPTDKGAVRSVFRAPSITLDELEYHITTLNPNQSPHPPHQHVNEEVIIVKEGAVEAFVNGAWTPVTTGSLIFFASNVPHTVRNVGSVAATYHVVNWKTPGAGAESDGREVTGRVLAGVVAALGAALAAPAASAQSPVGYFEGSGDVGAPALAGSTTYDASAQTYTIVGAGTNMWADPRRVPVRVAQDDRRLHRPHARGVCRERASIRTARSAGSCARASTPTRRTSMRPCTATA